MKSRLIFGVIIAESEHIIQKRIIKGMIAQALDMDIDLAIFSCTSNDANMTLHQCSEMNLYRYMNFNTLDGIIYARATIHSPEGQKMLDDMLLAQKKPVLVLDDDTSPFPCVMLEDKHSMAELTAHCIEAHGLTDLICLTGFRDNFSAEERAAGFREAMLAHDLPCSDDRIIYGDYWEQSARTLGMEIINGERPMPQGIVCANDAMAKFLCETLLNNGIAVPEQVTVVGYDAALTGDHTVISITSYVRKNFTLGAKAIARMYQLITNRDCKLVDAERITMITGRSCPCGDDEGYLRHVLRTKERSEHFSMMFRSGNMTMNLTSNETLDECMEQILKYVFLIRNCTEYYLCLCEDWEGSGAVETPNDYRREGFPDYMLLKIGDNKVLSKPFPTAKMLPRLHEERSSACAYFFTPIHHNDRFFGISAFSFGDTPDSYDPLYCSWKAAVDVALEYVRMQNYLKRFNNRIYLSSIRDSLTGLYNTEGHHKFSEECFEAAKREQRRFLLLYAQCDGVRQLNESYGHSEGDSAITVLANAVSNSCSTNERCARIQDGVFSIIGYRDYATEAGQRFIKAINTYLDQYNQTSLKPYKVNASYGVFCDYLKPTDTLDSINELVHRKLTDDKQRNESERTVPYYRQFVDLRERIYSNPSENWNIDTMCQALILSRGYFQKLYTRCFGISFTQDVINSRISLSKRLLASTEMSIADISERCGYANYVHFMHQFKKVVGMTATDYRKKAQQE